MGGCSIAFYMNCVSTHQLPLAREVVALVGRENFVYVFEGESAQVYQRVTDRSNIKCEKLNDDSRVELENVEKLYTGLRDIVLFEHRAEKGLKTFYTSERWFKPIQLRGIKVEDWRLKVGEWNLPGSLRMLMPGYRRMVKRFVNWANTDPNARVLAIGPHAKRDFLKMGVRAEGIVDWGYYVAPSEGKLKCEVEQRNSSSSVQLGPGTSARTLKVLWVGRDLTWKRIKDIERAVALANKKLTSSNATSMQRSSVPPLVCVSPKGPITFTKLTGVTPAEVRVAMRSHNLYVLASNAEEGWGAALNEALEEGMNAIGTYEAGASAAILPSERLYHAGDVKVLARLLELEYRGELPPCSIGEWTAKHAAKRLMELVI